jgi:hypothetical protein
LRWRRRIASAEGFEPPKEVPKLKQSKATRQKAVGALFDWENMCVKFTAWDIRRKPASDCSETELGGGAFQELKKSFFNLIQHVRAKQVT